MDLRRIRQLGRLSVWKVQEERIFEKEVRSPSHELFHRYLSMRGMPRYLDRRELRVKTRRFVM